MKTMLRGSLTWLAGAALGAALSALAPMQAWAFPYQASATISGQTWADFKSLPLTSATSVPPMVMLTLSRDQQLHYKAYNDYSDIDNDGVIETTYNNSIDYYGYFDSYKCYTYSSGITTPGPRFVPSSITADKYCSGQWSGNFLNWVSMSRMDAVRKLLYGGMRSTDTLSTTVLERDYLTTDAHSWAKFYNGADITKLTPFTASDFNSTAPSASFTFSSALTIDSTANTITGTLVSIQQPYKINLFRFTMNGLALANPAVGDQIRVEPSTGTGTVFLIGAVSSVVGPNVTVDVYPSNFQGTATFTAAKVTDLSKAGISFCNLTYGPSGLSQNDVNPPLLRVASGNFELWGANEKKQCEWAEEFSNLQAGFDGGFFSNGNRAFLSGLSASAENPQEGLHGLGTGNGPTGSIGVAGNDRGQYVVRVEACVSGLENRERCETYPSGNKKPIGLLQVYGETDRIRFGLITPSYQKNISGGVLRKNVDVFTNEVNETTDGTFVSATAGNGIVSNLNKLRMYGYDYSQNDNYGSGDGCTYQRTGIAPNGSGNVVSEGNCSSWGNPLGEAYIEGLLYFAGKPSTPEFQYGAGSRDATLGLTVATAVDPITPKNYCSNLNVLAFNASVSSYDNDQTGILSALKGAPNGVDWTNSLGANENLGSGTYFVGNSGSPGDDNLCSAKTIGNLGNVLGICPEAPSLKGTYLMAGAAWYAHTNRIRPDITSVTPAVPSAADNSSFKVTTYGVALATNVPKIVVPNPDGSGRFVTILPAYRLDLGSNGVGGGALVDFRIVRQDLVAGTGTFYVNWEDSSQGGDYDQDMWGTISYKISGNTIDITTDAISASTANGQGFGYIISGTTKDGPHFHSGIYGFNYTDAVPVTVKSGGGNVNGTTFPGTGGGINSSGGCQNCQINDPPTVVSYTLGTGSAQALPDPLFYAAKYGGFQDANNDGHPDTQSEWDSRKQDGTPGADGIPDNYFYVSNPTQLEASLQRAFDAIVAKSASGTAASIVANAREGEGAVYQALYEPLKQDLTRSVRWIGTVQSLFIDADGNLREDADHDGTLGDFTADPAVAVFFDDTTRTTRIKVYAGDPKDNSFHVAELGELETLWNARTQLAAVPQASITTQRTYGALANLGRYIFTGIDTNLDGTVTQAEVRDFTANKFGAGFFGILNEKSQVDAQNLVDYIRGKEIASYRNRLVDYFGKNPAGDSMLLGDIVQSSPTVVGTPAESFDLLYNDGSYATFRSQYRRRRNMVYAGGNDGMLHAFNGGFYVAQNNTFQLTGLKSEVSHPLGSELWAYVPYNLLPHLPWLSDPDYNHVWYMDGEPRVFDARIFAADADHPGGWGTVLVAGMRLGGTSVSMLRSTAPTGFSSIGTTETKITTRPAYVIMDVTNPEVAPKLIAELSDPNLGFTTSYPTAVAIVGKTGTTFATGDWYLVFGSGPFPATSPNTTTSTQAARLYVYNLVTRSFASGYNPVVLTEAPTSFVGDPVTVDWDLDFKADALYFGTIGGTPGSNATGDPDTQTGKLFKLDFGTSVARQPSDWTPPIVALDPGKPVISTPSVTQDEQGRHWVFGGTGRFFGDKDKVTPSPQWLFGIVDNKSTIPAAGSALYDFSQLVDVTNAKVATTGAITGITPASINTEPALISQAIAKNGWKLGLTIASPSERNVTRSSLLGDILFMTTFIPSTDLCAGEGSSELFGLFYKTGAAKVSIPTFGPDAQNFLIRKEDFSVGLASAPGLQTGGSVDQTALTVMTQTSTGAIEVRDAKVDPGARSGEADWRERF